MNRISLFVCSLIAMFSCDYSYEKKIGENYFIRSIESRERMDIGFGTSGSSEGLIEPTVFEVHWDDLYILAKRHPLNLGANAKTVTEYYIIKKVSVAREVLENMYGPLNFEEYEKKKAVLGINEKKMKSIVYDDLK